MKYLFLMSIFLLKTKKRKAAANLSIFQVCLIFEVVLIFGVLFNFESKFSSLSSFWNLYFQGVFMIEDV